MGGLFFLCDYRFEGDAFSLATLSLRHKFAFRVGTMHGRTDKKVAVLVFEADLADK